MKKILFTFIFLLLAGLAHADNAFFMGVTWTASATSVTDNVRDRVNQYTSSKTGILTSIYVLCANSDGNIQSLVYADGGTDTPTALLARGNTYTATANGWSEYKLRDPATVNSGVLYWIGGRRSGANTTYKYDAIGKLVLSDPTTFGIPQNPMGTGMTFAVIRYSLYASGLENYYQTSCYIGITYTAGSSVVPAGVTNMRACKFTAVRDGTIDTVHLLLYDPYDTFVMAGVYDGTTSTPVNLLSTSGIYPAYCANSLTITPIAVYSGTNYWLVWQTSGTQIGVGYYYNTSSDNNQLQAAANTFGTFSSTYGTINLTQNRQCSVFASGTDFTPTPTPTATAGSHKLKKILSGKFHKTLFPWRE